MKTPHKLDSPEAFTAAIKALDFPHKLKLSVYVALYDSAGLPPDQRKDIIKTAIDVYSRVFAVELITKLLNDDYYKKLPKEFDRDQLKLAALALWADESIDKSGVEVRRFVNLMDLISDAKKPKEGFHGD